MQAPLPRRTKGPSAIAAASAAIGKPGSGSEDGSATEPAPEATPEATPPAMSPAASSFVAELTTAPQDQAAAGAAEAVPQPPARRRLPRVSLLAGAAVVVAAVIGGAFFLADAGDTRQSASPGALPDTSQGGGPSYSSPSLLASPPPSASPSAHRESASPKSPAKGSATPGTTARAQPSAAAATGTHHTVADDGDSGSSCTRAAGSGPLTGLSVCASSGTVTFQATFGTSQPYYHVFINADGDTRTGYQLPYPSPSALGADYMIENGSLYRSRSTDWSWTETATHLTTKVSGSTRTWTLSLRGIGSPAGTQKVEFNAGSDYTPVLSFSPK